MLMTDHEIARVTHEVNRAYCAAVGDASQAPWEAAPAWQQESAVDGVRFHRANPGSNPAANHENWLREKMVAGWVWGPVKRPDLDPPEHPCFVSYGELPVEQRVKDYLFSAIVRALD